MENDSSLSTMDRPPQKFGRFRIIKNLVVMSISMMLISTAYDGLSMLQSTLNQEIGTASQALVYTIQFVSSLILPKYVVKKFGCKCIFVAALVLFLPYIAANFYPTWFTLVFTAILLGVAMSLIFASQTSYFNESVLLYCRLNSIEKEKNSDPESCICEETGKKEVLNYFSEDHKKNLHLGRNSNATKEVAVPRKRISCQVLPKRNTDCTDVNKGMGILKVKELNKSGDSLENNVSENNSFKHFNLLKNEEEFSMTNPAFTISDELTQAAEIKTSNKLAASVISNVNHELLDVFVSHDDSSNIKNNLPITNIELEFKTTNLEIFNEKDRANCGTIDIQDKAQNSRNHGNLDVSHDEKNLRNNGTIGEGNNARETIDFQRQNIESVTARFFGASGLAFHFAQVWGNLISYLVLQNSNKFSGNPLCVCGAALCRTELMCFGKESSAGTEDGTARYLLTGISLATAVLSLLLVTFLMDPLGTDKDPSAKLSLNFLMATLRHCKNKTQMCLLPISLYVGMLQGFYTADFTKSYIACALGPYRVGLVTATYGLSCALSSPLAGFLVKYTGRIPVFLLMQTVNLSVLVFLLLWSPNSDDPFMLYATAILLGLVTGTQWSQIPAFHGILFKKDEEAAFASYYLFNSLGWSLSFAYSDHLCMSVKLYVLLAVSCLGIIGYLTAERTYYASTRTT